MSNNIKSEGEKQGTSREKTITVDTYIQITLSKIPSEMEVAPPHKRFSQFSALIKL